MSYVLVGGSGVLGTGFRVALARRGAPVSRVQPDWSSPSSVAAALEAPLLEHVRGGGTTTVIWAAGVGAVGATAAAMAAETESLALLADGIRRLPGDSAARLSVVLASSAGAVFAGHGPTPVHETSTPAPTSDYGRVKLAQERLLEQLSADVGCRALACRYSNLYGLASGRVTARGLVSTAVRASRYRQPMTVYVSADSRRDYLYAQDAAAQSLHRLEAAGQGFSTALVCDGAVRTVASVISLVGHVSGRRVPATYAERPETRLQPRVLRFSPAAGPRTRRTPMETGVHRMVRAPVA
jgi:UDP-glucose 4-epimerase